MSQSEEVGEPRVDMNEPRAAFLRLQCKAEGDRVIFGRVGLHHEDAVRICQIALGERAPSPAVARAQTWDGGAVSDARRFSLKPCRGSRRRSSRSPECA